MLQRSKVPLWLTFNEPNAIRGVCMMVIKDQCWQTYWQAIHHMCVAGALAVKMDRELCPGARFSTMFAMSEFYAASPRPADVWAAPDGIASCAGGAARARRDSPLRGKTTHANEKASRPGHATADPNRQSPRKGKSRQVRPRKCDFQPIPASKSTQRRILYARTPCEAWCAQP